MVRVAISMPNIKALGLDECVNATVISTKTPKNSSAYQRMGWTSIAAQASRVSRALFTKLNALNNALDSALSGSVFAALNVAALMATNFSSAAAETDLFFDSVIHSSPMIDWVYALAAPGRSISFGTGIELARLIILRMP